MRKRAHDGSLVRVSGADPLNLVGTLLPGEKIPALAGNRVLYRDGIPVATLIAGQPRYLAQIGPEVGFGIQPDRAPDPDPEPQTSPGIRLDTEVLVREQWRARLLGRS